MFHRMQCCTQACIEEAMEQTPATKVLACKIACYFLSQASSCYMKITKRSYGEDFNEQARIQAERARRQREESVVQNLDMKLYEKPGRKPLESEAKLNTWKTKMKENAIMKKYNKRLDHLRQMLSSLGEYQNAKDSRSGAWDKSVQDDLQKSLGEIAGRRFPRFKRLTQEEKQHKTGYQLQTIWRRYIAIFKYTKYHRV